MKGLVFIPVLVLVLVLVLLLRWVVIVSMPLTYILFLCVITKYM